MSNFILAHESAVRLGAYLGVFLAIAIWEVAAPRRLREVSRWVRWPGNLGIAALNIAVLRLTIPAVAVGTAVLGQQRGWGLLNNIVLSSWVRVTIAVLALDLAIYLQHVM
jgi:sterol desaturase/sphingolipid hydroxylase (fatty acid hydroxylase superfamily)